MLLRGLVLQVLHLAAENLGFSPPRQDPTLQHGGKGPELLQALGELRRQVCKPGFPIQLSLSEGVRLASTIALAKAEDFELLTRKFDFWAPQRRATGEAWPFPLTAARRFSDVTHPTTKLLIIY